MQSKKSVLHTQGFLPPCDLELLVSLSTPVLLGVLLLQRSLQDWGQTLGEASEAIFRGEQLPLQVVPPSAEQDTST
jgi:hypothetical protein